jgi:hypothetical protein
MAKKNIIEGFTNLALSKVKLLVEEAVILSNERMNVCNKCPFKSKKNTCKKCGCFLPAKTKVKLEKCPINKW